MTCTRRFSLLIFDMSHSLASFMGLSKSRFSVNFCLFEIMIRFRALHLYILGFCFLTKFFLFGCRTLPVHSFCISYRLPASPQGKSWKAFFQCLLAMFLMPLMILLPYNLAIDSMSFYSYGMIGMIVDYEWKRAFVRHYIICFWGSEMIVHFSISSFNFWAERSFNGYFGVLYFFILLVAFALWALSTPNLDYSITFVRLF